MVGGIAFYIDHHQRDLGFAKTRGSKALITYGLLSFVTSITLIVANAQINSESPHFSSVPVAYFTNLLATILLQLGSLLLLQKGLLYNQEASSPSSLDCTNECDSGSCRRTNDTKSTNRCNRAPPPTPTSQLAELSDRFPFIARTSIPVAPAVISSPSPLPRPVSRSGTSTTSHSLLHNCYGPHCDISANEDGSNTALSKRNRMLTTVWKFPATVLLVTSAILGLVGNMNLIADDGHLGTFGPNCVKAASLLELFALVPVGAQTTFCFVNRAQAYTRQHRMYLYATIASLPFLLIRNVYNIASAFALHGHISSFHKFSLVNGSWRIRAGMDTSMDILAALAVAGSMALIEIKAINRNKSSSTITSDNQSSDEVSALLAA